MSDERPSSEKPDQPMPRKESHNLVSDIVTGVNVRRKDNLFQGLTILVSFVTGAYIGSEMTPDPKISFLYLMFGGFIGLVVGLFVSGFVLMVLRTARHMRGDTIDRD